MSPRELQEFWGYLIDPEQPTQPTALFRSLLLAIAAYAVEHLEPCNIRELTPEKISSLYHSIDGDPELDTLFLGTPHAELSSIYSTLGCAHSLQPTPGDDFRPPCVPALTPRGFATWQTVQLLLDPAEHVPYIQTAVRKFPLKHPETGEYFPRLVPVESFPTQPDAETIRWHDERFEQKRAAEAAAAATADESPLRAADAMNMHARAAPAAAAAAGPDADTDEWTRYHLHGGAHQRRKHHHPSRRATTAATDPSAAATAAAYGHRARTPPSRPHHSSAPHSRHRRGSCSSSCSSDRDHHDRDRGRDDRMPQFLPPDREDPLYSPPEYSSSATRRMHSSRSRSRSHPRRPASYIYANGTQVPVPDVAPLGGGPLGGGPLGSGLGLGGGLSGGSSSLGVGGLAPGRHHPHHLGSHRSTPHLRAKSASYYDQPLDTDDDDDLDAAYGYGGRGGGGGRRLRRADEFGGALRGADVWGNGAGGGGVGGGGGERGGASASAASRYRHLGPGLASGGNRGRVYYY